MRLRPESVVVLHDLYHRKEEGKYIVGDPQTGAYLIVTAPEFRAIQLLHSGLSLGHAQKLLDAEKDPVKLRPLLKELKDQGFVHRIDNHVIMPHHDVLHDFSLPLKWLGGQSARFLLIVLSLFGLWTLVWRGTFPGPQAFFYQPTLSVTLLFVVLMAWLLIAAREIAKYAAARNMGIEARLGFRNHYHLFLLRAYTPGLSEPQRHRVLGHGLLALTALTSIALMLSTYLHPDLRGFWNVVYAIGVIEILCECLLFLDTDLAQYIALTSKIHKLNTRTSMDLREHWRALWSGKRVASNHELTTYSFFYMVSVIVAAVLLISYLVPSMLGFLLQAFAHFKPGDALAVDSFLVLTFFSVDLLLYGIAMLRHHHLAHNTYFINTGLLVVTVGSYIAAAVGIQWFAMTTDTLLTVILSYALGIVLAAVFVHSVLLAHPFTRYHDLFERGILPVLAACLPIAIIFAVPHLDSAAYLYALFLGGGMLTFAGLKELWRSTYRSA